MRLLLCGVVLLCLNPAMSAEISGRIHLKATAVREIELGFVGKNTEGKIFNGAFSTLVTRGPDGGAASYRGSGHPTVTLTWDAQADCSFNISNLPSGIYFVYVRWADAYMEWQIAELQSTKSSAYIDLTVDPGLAGAIRIHLPKKDVRYAVWLIPISERDEVPLPGVDLSLYTNLKAYSSDGIVNIQGVRSGRYFLILRKVFTKLGIDGQVSESFVDVSQWIVQAHPGALVEYAQQTAKK